jgi:hypothetical protein
MKLSKVEIDIILAYLPPYWSEEGETKKIIDLKYKLNKEKETSHLK